LEIKNASHNHGALPIHTVPRLRVRERKRLLEVITAQLNAGIYPRQILEAARQNDSSDLIPRDIYNLRQNLYREFLDGRPLIQALLTVLPKEGHWLFNHMLDGDNRLTGLFCTH
jgi:hypothetical protein